MEKYDIVTFMSNPAPPIRSLSALLQDLKKDLKGDNISINDLATALHERGIAMLLLLFAAPMALPIPVPPGINIMLATPLLLLTGQQAMGARTIWLPQKIKQKSFARVKLENMIGGIIPWMKRLEVLLKPRLGWITQDGPSRFFGLLGLVMALTVCIPVPLTNTVPSFGIALMSVGFIMRDGLAIMVGALIGTAWVLMLTTAIIIFGPEAFDIVKETIKSIL